MKERTDTERLDWLLALSAFVQIAANCDDEPLKYAVRVVYNITGRIEAAWPSEWYDTPRAAIDAAMEAA